jgi:hypothetical protein
LLEARAGSDEGSERTASERIFAYGVHVAVRFTNIHGIRSFAIIGMILLCPSSQQAPNI